MISELLVHFFKFNRIKLYLSKKPRSTSSVFSVNKIYAMQNKIEKYIWQRSCFRRCITLKLIMLMYGKEAQIIFGLKKNSFGKIEGHSWLKSENLELNQTKENIESYTVTDYTL